MKTSKTRFFKLLRKAALPTAFSLAVASILLTACVSYPVVNPQGSGGAVVAVSSTGIILNQQGRDHLVREGVPTAWFQAVPTGYFLTNLQWNDARAIQIKNANTP